MEYDRAEVAERIRGLRDILEISAADMAKETKIPLDEYLACEAGERDFSFMFLYNCARKFGVDLTELLTGERPRLSVYSVVRKGEGLPIRRRAGFEYLNLAYLFSGRTMEPFLVTAPYREEEQDAPIVLSSHSGQEFDYILEGRMKFTIDGHVELLEPGDAVYYASGSPHGMIAVGGEPCRFLSFVIKAEQETKQ